jgi:hypothetical protein
MARRGASSETKAKQSSGLGFIPEELQHGFILHLPAGRAATADVFISEHRDFVLEQGEIRPRPVTETDPDVRVNIKRVRWDEIATAFFEEATRRLRHAGMAVPTLPKSGPIPMLPSLGKELCLLCWAIEDADTQLIPEAIRNWEGLAPEERWWLYTMTAAATGQAKQRGIGWRKALRFALTENPIAKGEGLPPRTRKQLVVGSQLRLL